MSMKRQGVTLIELLVVVIVVAIIAGLAVPGYSRMIEKVRAKDAQGTLSILLRAEQMYKLANLSFGTLVQMVNGKYLDPDPNPDPNWTFSTSGVGATAFIATATRNAGSSESGKTIQLDQNWTGDTIAGAPYNGKKYYGNHPLHD